MRLTNIKPQIKNSLRTPRKSLQSDIKSHQSAEGRHTENTLVTTRGKGQDGQERVATDVSVPQKNGAHDLSAEERTMEDLSYHTEGSPEEQRQLNEHPFTRGLIRLTYATQAGYPTTSMEG